MKPTAHPSAATAILALARRDLLEFVRDRRTLVITLLLPMAVYPILTLATTLGLQTATRALDAQMAAGRIQVGLSGPDAAGLARLMQRTIETTSRNERATWPSEIVLFDVDESKAEDLLDHGGIDLWIATPAGLLADLAAARPVRIPVRVSASRPATTLAREQFAEFMRSLSRDVARDRLEAAGLSGALLEPLAVVFAGDSGSAAPPPTQAIIPTIIGGILVMLTVLTLTGAFYPAIDAIAGEKERGTIETLLIAPCRTSDVVYGKFLSVLAITLATLVANVVSIAATVAVALRYLPKGVVAALPEGSLGTALLVTVLAFTGMAALAAATCLAVTTASKSGKEAQNTLTPVILLVSAVAGTALLPGMDGGPLLAAVPFAGQIVVARAAFGTGTAPPATAATILATLATSLASSAVVTWLLLRLTAGTLTDEDVLFRGPDVAGSPLQRPARRPRPTAVQALVPLVAGFAGLWYAQGLVPSDLCWAIPVQQVIAGLAPLAFVTWWQRVDLRDTFSWRWPGRGGRLAAVLLGALLVGGGLFVLGAAALLAVRTGGLSAEVRQLSARLIALVRERPWWLSWSLIAVVPAVCEELVFRGWVLAGLLGRGQSPARTAAVIVAQALAFALFHLLPERMPQAFALGVVNGLLVVATRSLLPAIACHLAHNSVPVALLLLAADVPGLAAAAEGGTAAVAALPAWVVAVAASAVAVGAGLIATGMHDRTHEETTS